MLPLPSTSASSSEPLKPCAQPLPLRLSQDESGDVSFLGPCQDLVRDARAAQGDRLATKLLGEAESADHGLSRGLADLAGHFHEHGGPGRLQPLRHAARGANEPQCGWIGTDAHRQAVARGPGVTDALAPHVPAHLGIDPVRGLPQGQLAQGNEIALAEEPFERPARLVGQVHPALPQALQQDVGGDIDQLDFVGPLEHGIGQRLAHGDAGDLRHHIIEALDVLHVERGVDIDAGIEQFEHVLPALAVPAAGGVGMGQLIHENEPRLPRQRGVEVELLQYAALVVDCTTRKDGEALGQARGLAPAMGLDHADHDVHPLGLTRARGLEHGVGFSHARGRAKEQFQPAALLPRLLVAEFGEESIRIGPARITHSLENNSRVAARSCDG